MMLSQKFFMVSILCYCLGGLFSLAFQRFSKTSNYLGQGLAVLGGVFGSAAAIYSLLYQQSFTLALPNMIPITKLTLTVDSLSAYFILIVSILATAVSIYTLGYAQEYYASHKAGLLGFLYNFFVLSMVLVVSASNVVLFLILWELMTLVSYLLVVFDHRQGASRRAGFIYIVMTHLGTIFITMAFLTLYYYTNSFNFADYKQIGALLPEQVKNIIFLLALIGFGTKAGIIPLHIWLPYAHPAAPSNISALMSGVMIKTALYGVIRVIFGFLGPGPAWWGITLIVVGAVSALLGIIYALMERDIKRLLAYSSVENMGIMFMGLGAALLFLTFGQESLAVLALIAALYHAFNHAIFKGLLFLGAGSVVYATHTKDIEQMGGLIKKMPWTALFFLVGAVSISALPPLNGFISEWLTFQSLLQLGFEIPSGTIHILASLSGAALALTGALAAACFVKAFGISFLALPRSEHATNAREVPLNMRFGMAILAVFCLGLGILPGPVILALNRVTELMLGTVSLTGIKSSSWFWPSIQSGMGEISTLALIIILLALALAIGLIPKIIGGKTEVRVSETWNCGEKLRPSMEYNATSFAKPIRILFKSILMPNREVAATYQEAPYFGKTIKYESKLKPVFEDFLYHPLTKLVIWIAHRIRSIQTGSIHLYLSYILITLVILLLVVR